MNEEKKEPQVESEKWVAPENTIENSIDNTSKKDNSDDFEKANNIVEPKDESQVENGSPADMKANKQDTLSENVEPVLVPSGSQIETPEKPKDLPVTGDEEVDELIPNKDNPEVKNATEEEKSMIEQLRSKITKYLEITDERMLKLTDRIKELNEKTQQLEKELELVKVELSKKEQSNHELSEQNSEMHEEIEKLNTELTSLKEEREILNKKKENYEKDNKEMKDLLLDIEKRLETRQKE